MINYSLGKDDYKDWKIEETTFNDKYLGKFEAISCLGNGYMGVRGSLDEKYLTENRTTFIAGTFDRFEGDVCELPNVPDLTEITIIINEVTLNLTEGEIESYSRVLNLKDGCMTREVLWNTPKTGRIKFIFERFVSLSDFHFMGMKVRIVPLDMDIQLTIISGINGRVTNKGTQHFTEGDKRLYHNQFLNGVYTTVQSKIDFVISTSHKFIQKNKEIHPKQLPIILPRQIKMKYDLTVDKDEEITIEKLSNIYTTKDKDHIQTKLEDLKDISIESLKKVKNYETSFLQSKNKYHDFWNQNDIKIESIDSFNQLAIRFAQYHLLVMTPKGDNRINIAAKGLSGEGYRGHVFWDTEIFMLPYYIYQDPKTAQSLLEYRYLCLDGARRKAQENGFDGAMYPWECAAITDGETTPLWGAADIITGKPTKILSGLIEIHITADVAYAVWQYYKITNDNDFMDRYGYEILFDTAKFWNSRFEWNHEKDRYEITDVVGPDEYKEHIDNNAFTNYMAYFNIDIAIKLYDELKMKKSEIIPHLESKLHIEEVISDLKNKREKIYLPLPNSDGIIPQNDSYMSLSEIDLEKYKGSKRVGILFDEYSLDQVNGMKVSKQADLLVLLYLLEDKFEYEIKEKNFDYYEKRTLHDSSLSYTTHGVLASEFGNSLAYEFFEKASRIDLGDHMTSSDEGIHAASMGGIWQIIVNGFGGVRLAGTKLKISPNLPIQIHSIEFFIYYHNVKLEVKIAQKSFVVKNTDREKSIDFMSYKNEYTIKPDETIIINR